MNNFTISKNEGYVNITNFIFSVDALSAFNYSKYLWDFGDGVRSREKTPTHFYTNPSSYKVTLNAYTISSLDVYTQEIKVDLFLNNSIYFDYVPPPTFAGHLNRYPFKINITSPNLDEHVIDLYANFSRSYAPQDKNLKWTFLRPQWRFLDVNGNQIYYIKTKDSIIKADNDGRLSDSGIVAGVTGTAEFYFVDDIYNFDLFLESKPYTSIIATLRTASTKAFNDVTNINPELPSDSNSLAQVVVPYIVLWRTPDYLKITENGVREHTNPRWLNTKNPVVINSDFKDLEYPDIITDGKGVSVLNKNSFFAEYIPLSETETVLISSNFIGASGDIYPKPVEFKFYDDNNFKSSGYYKGNFVIANSGTNVSLSAAATITIPELSGNYFNPLIWVPNPAAGNINVIQYIKNEYNQQLYLNTQNIVNQDKAIVHDIQMPLVSSADFIVDSMALTGHHGINCVAALPLPCYHAWTIDSDLNQLYRLSSQGQILCSINLKSLLNQSYISPSYCVLDGDQNLWVTLHDTTSTLKFDKYGNLLFNTKVEMTPSESFSIYNFTIPASSQQNILESISENFTSPNWTKTAFATVSSNMALSPEGSLTANLFKESSTVSGQKSLTYASANLIGNNVYHLSIFVKAENSTPPEFWFYINATGAFSSVQSVRFNLSLKTIIPSGSQIQSTGIENYGNGWYRLNMKVLAQNTGLMNLRLFLARSSSLTYVATEPFRGLYIWGADLKASSNLTPYISQNTKNWFYDTQYYPLTSDSFVDGVIDPTCVDIDTKNNAWVSYSNSFNSFISKLSSNGVTLSSISYPLGTSPTELVCDNQDNVWIALSDHIYKDKNFLEKRNSFGEKLSTFGPFKGLSYLTIDINQNPWFVHSYQYIGTIINNNVSSYKIPLNGIYKNPANWLDKTTYITEPSSKNYLLWSNGFENSYWNKHQISVIPNSEIAPNELEAAEFLFENAGLSGMYGLSSGRVDLTGSNVGSIFVKPDSRFFIELSLLNNVNGTYANAIFDLSTKAITGVQGNFGIYELENNWYRCYVSGNVANDNNRFLINLHDGVSSIYVGTSSLYEQTSSGNSSFNQLLCAEATLLYQQNISSETLLPQPTSVLFGLYVWGAQWEVGQLPSSYIPTSGFEIERPNKTINVIGNIDESALKGIAFNGKDNLYIINSLESEMVVFDLNQKQIKDRFYINPKGFNYYPSQKDNIINRGSFLREIQSVGSSTEVEYHPWLNSMVVNGDWTSWRWSNKFRKIYSNTKYLSGSSRKLDFYDQSPYEFYKTNENYDMAKQMKDLAFMPSLQESEFLFDKFLKNIFGNKKHDDLGVLVYEKISNYLENHSDIDTCNINSLYNLAASVNLDSDDFRLNYPFLIRRLMDLASINKTRLWGDKDKTSTSFGDATKTGVLNRGNLLNTLTYQVTGGIPVVLKTRSLMKYNLILTGPIKQTINNQIISNNFYSLNDLSSYIGLPTDWNQYYEYYEYISNVSNKQLEGVIDWENPNTTLNYNNSSLNLWDGNEGILETAFNYELYKGLNILNSN